MGNRFFHFKQFSILSQDKGLKVGTDACLLGAIAESEQVLRCLDIGTGTGVIALMLAQKYPRARIEAVEIDPVAARQANENFSSSRFADRIVCHQQDYLLSEFSHRFDLICCNPPYFENHLKSADPHRNMAIHNQTLPMEGLLEKVAGHLNPNACFWVIYPPSEAGLLLEKATATGWHLQQGIRVFNKPGKHFRTLLCLNRKTAQKTSWSDLLLNTKDGSRSEAFSRLMQAFYLENTEQYRLRSK